MLTIVGTYFTALCHYIFAAEFLSTRLALEATIKGLEICVSDFVTAKKESRELPSTMRRDESSGEPLQETLKVRMDNHLKATKRKERLVVAGHIGLLSFFAALTILGFFVMATSILCFLLMILTAVSLYAYGLWGIHRIVTRFELTLPSQRASCLHIFNMTMLLVGVFATCVNEFVMFHMYDGKDKKVEDSNEEQYLKDSFNFEISFSVAFAVDVLTSLIAGHLIKEYS